MTDYIDTQGTSLKRGDGASPENFTTVPRLTKIGPIPIASSKPLRDRTDLSHTDARQHGFGLADMKEIVCEGFLDVNDATHQALKTDYDNGTRRNFQLVFASSPAYTLGFYPCLVMMEIGEVNLDGDLPFTLTLKPQAQATEV